MHQTPVKSHGTGLCFMCVYSYRFNGQILGTRPAVLKMHSFVHTPIKPMECSNNTTQDRSVFFFKKDELWDHSIACVVNIIICATQSVVISLSPLWNRAQAGRVILWSTSGADLQK